MILNYLLTKNTKIYLSGFSGFRLVCFKQIVCLKIVYFVNIITMNLLQKLKK
jgi:hypothetical protein